MKLLVFIAPNDFRDESLALMRLFFEKWGVEYSITSYSKKECRGFHGSACTPDVNTNTVNTRDFDGIVIIDGKGIESYLLHEYRPLLDLVYEMNRQNKHIIAVGNAIRVVARANIIKGKRVSEPNDEETRKQIILFHGIPTSSEVEAEGNLCTIRDPRKLELTIPSMLQGLGVK